MDQAQAYKRLYEIKRGTTLLADTTSRDEAILTLHKSGVAMSTLIDLTGLSRSLVYAIVKAAK